MSTQELNIGGSIVVAALEDACGTNKSKVRDLYNSLGDLGMKVIFFLVCHNGYMIHFLLGLIVILSKN